MEKKRVKPEHMTHLDHKTLVHKDHPRIAFRGWIDRLEAEILLCRLTARERGFPQLCGELDEMLGFVRGMIRCDVLGEKVGEISLGGYTAEQLREYSHYPERYFGQGHFMASGEDEPLLLHVNAFRSSVMERLCGYAATMLDGLAINPGDVIFIFSNSGCVLSRNPHPFFAASSNHQRFHEKQTGLRWQQYEPSHHILFH